MISVQGLTKNFGDVKALDKVSFEVPKGKIVGFLGANGAGKTTTLDILAGCSGADQGTIKINDYDITEQPILAKKQIGYLPDEPPLYPEMKVTEYIKFGGQLKGLKGKKLHSRMSAMIDQMDLSSVAGRLVGNLSKGFSQRVALAQTLVHDPSVLILDEPTEGLDPKQIVDLRNLIKSLAGEHTIFLSSHILAEVENTCEHIIVIDKGRIVHQGSYSELAKKRQATSTYTIRLKNNGVDFAQTLEKIPEIATLEFAGENEIEFSLANEKESSLDEIVSQAISSGCGICELTKQKKSLEDVFRQLTN